MSAVTQTRLKELLDYNPATGVFVWRVYRGGRAKAGTEAGHVLEKTPRSGGPYLIIHVDGHPYYAHRLAFLYMDGALPGGPVDHCDCDGLNNRWENLRRCTPGQNQANRGKYKNNTTGYKGVHFDRKTSRYNAQLSVNGRSHWLGWHDTAEQAHAAYRAASKRLNGEFSRAV